VHYAQAGHVADSVVLAIVSLPLLLLDIWVWRRLLTNHPALIFLPDALIEQASLFGAGRLERSEIAGVRVGTAGYWRLVYLDLHHRAGRWTTPAIPAVLLGLSADALADEIGRWLKSVGDEVLVGEELCEIETEKVTTVYQSPFAGRLIEIGPTGAAADPVLNRAEPPPGDRDVPAVRQVPAHRHRHPHHCVAGLA